LRLRRHHASLFQLSYDGGVGIGELDTLGFQYGQALNEVIEFPVASFAVDFGAPVTVLNFPDTRLRGVEGAPASPPRSGAPDPRPPGAPGALPGGSQMLFMPRPLFDGLFASVASRPR